MTATAFDTLKAAEALAAAGIEEPHAKAIAGAMRDAVAEGVATKADLATLRGDLGADIAGLENRMVKFAFGLALAIVAMNTALIVGLLRAFGWAG